VVSSGLNANADAVLATTNSVLTALKAAISKQTAVHVVSFARSGSTSTTENIVADVGVTSGAETVSLGKSHLSVRVTATYAFVRGNSSGLVNLFGLSSAEAKKAGSEWVSFKTGTSQYSNVKADVTFRSVTALLPRAKGTKLSTEVVNGTKLDVLKWTSPSSNSVPTLSNTLTVSTGLITLPVKVTSIAANGTKETTTLSKWGELVLVSAPPAASSIASSEVAG
jgi:hypothetical protein